MDLKVGTRIRRFLFSRRVFSSADMGTDFLVYTVKAGDRLDTLANQFAGDARKWWVIADVNDIVDYPLDLTPGQELKIPSQRFFERVV